MKNQGISLISLIITIIVIIILAAIVLFNGLNAPNSANFAKFTQSVDNVSMAVLNKYAKLLEHHAISGDSRTSEQIYLEIATGTDNQRNAYMGTKGGEIDATTTKASDSTHVQHIQPLKSTDVEHSIGMKLPLVRETNNGWFVTSDGIIFNATGYEYDKKTYFTGSYYVNKPTDSISDNTKLSTRAKAIADVLSGDSSNNIIPDSVLTGPEG